MLQLPFHTMKSQYDSTDIYSDQSSQGSSILLRISGLDPRWKELLLNAQGSDFKIVHHNISYAVHRTVIFKHINLHVLDDQTTEGCLHAPDTLNSQLLTGILSCLYGQQLMINRTEALEALDVVYFLKISKLKRILEEDILENFQQYELFPVLERARAMGMQEVEEACLSQLEAESFEQMRYGKFQLLICNEQTFKFVLHRHKQRRWEDPAFGQTDKAIQDLIQDYCRHNGYTQRKKALLLKSLNQQTKSQFPSLANLRSSLNMKDGSNISIPVQTPRAVHTDSKIAPMKAFRAFKAHNGTKSMIMDKTFMSRRKKPNRASQNNSSHSKMPLDVITVKETFMRHDREIQQLKDSVEKIDQILNQKQGESSNNKFRLSEIESLLEECQKNIMENNRNVKLLDVKFDKFLQRRVRNIEGMRSQVNIQLSSDEDEEEKKIQNPKDQKLRVSLIQSKWVFC